MGKNLEFMDCPACGKRMINTAPMCHHCQHRSHSLPSSRSARHAPTENEHHAAEPLADPYDADSEMASTAGYSPDDEFDYDQFVAQEFPEANDRVAKPQVKRWIVITAWLLIVAMLLPFFYYFIAH